MSNFYISPTGAGKKDGSSWENAATIEKLGMLVDKANGGDSVLIRADQGNYTVKTPLTIAAGGIDGKPITIKGVTGSGAAMEATFVSDRAEVYTPTAAAGVEVFRIMGGADHLSFQNLGFKNVSNAFHFGADVTDITIEHGSATNVNRYIEDFVSGGATSASVSNLTVRDIDITGFAKGAIRLQYDSHDIVIDDVHGDGKNIDGSNFATGIAFDGTAHNIVVKNSSMGNITDTVNAYRNGDGFASERGNYNLQFIDTRAYNATDAGYDLKSTATVLTRAVAEGNTRNFRIWGEATLDHVTGIDPTYHGGTSSAANLWVWTGASATVIGSAFNASNATVAMIDVAAGGVLNMTGSTSNLGAQALVRLAAGGSMTGGLLAHLVEAVVELPLLVVQPVVPLDVFTTSATATLASGDATLTYTGTADFTGTGNAMANVITGGIGRDVLSGGAGNDVLRGGAGADTLDGGIGSDTMDGGAGDDLYIVDAAGDMVVEAPGGGIDTVNTTLLVYNLGNDVERLNFLGTTAFTGTGNALANIITGGVGDDLLDGGAGADTLVGGLGHDVYLVDRADDIVVELANAGVDEVRTTAAGYALGANVENLTFVGIGSFTGTGNDLDNTIAGAGGDDMLSGGRGNDVLNGNAGNDTLNGGWALDVLNGGDGNDLLIGEAHLDKLSGDAGDDVIIGDYRLLDGSVAAANDQAWGGAGNDTIYGDGITQTAGAAGRDMLYGGDGNDVIVGDADTMTGGTAGADWLYGDAGDDVIYGDGRTVSAGVTGGADIINGGAGNDTLYGGGGADRFVFDTQAFGNDVIGDFGRAAGARDMIDLQALRLKFSDLHITYDHGNAIVETPAHATITLMGISSVSAADFLF